jgi:uncharacterized protein with HEPN domain
MKDDKAYLLHILDAAKQIGEYTRSGESAFLSDRMIHDAVIRNFEIIGEAVKNLSEGLKANNPGTPWKDIAGMRDKLVHEYFGVKLQLVWQSVQKDLPPLVKTVEEIVRTM